MTEKSLSSLAKLFRYAKWALLILALVYLAQFVWEALYKGQSKMGAAFETIAQEALRRQYDGIPQMRVMGANTNPNYPYSECPFWNFERTWGRCIGVVLGVRDYSPGQRPIVEREVNKLADQLTKPCTLLSTLKLPEEVQLARELECDEFRKSFNLRILVDAVTVDSEHGPPASRTVGG
jgi:hypothetical protein